MTELHTKAALGVDEELWRATFAEFRSQALRTFQGNLFDIASGGWVDVGLAAAAAGETKEWSDIWPQQQWHIAFEILFCQQPLSIQAVLPEHDDLLFFVYWNDLSKTKGSRIFARRKRKLKIESKTSPDSDDDKDPPSALPLDLAWNSSLAADIDWRSSLILNIVLQTQYLLTVIRCPPGEVDQLLDFRGTPLKRRNRSALENPHQEQSMQSRHSSIYITKRVHASPSTTPVNLDQTKSSDSAPSVSYPNICFAVDDFVEAFDCLTLEDPEDCYCVVLHADVANTWSKAAALNTVDVHQKSREEDKGRAPPVVIEKTEQLRSLEAAFEDSLQIQTPPPRSSSKDPSLEDTLAVFNGYVSCKQLSAALDSYLKNPLKVFLQQRNQGRGQGGWSRGRGQGKAAKVLMRGPGGIGSAEVAVTALHSGNEAKETTLLESVFKSAVVAVKTAVQVEEQMASSDASGAAIKLQCALMAVNIPVEALAEQILKAV